MTRHTYTVWDALLASPTEPMPLAKRTYQLTRMWGGLAAIETAAEPTYDDWVVCSDAVNLMETLIKLGHVEDTSGLLHDAVSALANAGMRSIAGGAIRMSGAGIQAVRAILEDYAVVLETLSHRTMIHCHRITEKRIQEILAGAAGPNDINIAKDTK